MDCWLQNHTKPTGKLHRENSATQKTLTLVAFFSSKNCSIGCTLPWPVILVLEKQGLGRKQVAKKTGCRSLYLNFRRFENGGHSRSSIAWKKSRT